VHVLSVKPVSPSVRQLQCPSNVAFAHGITHGWPDEHADSGTHFDSNYVGPNSVTDI
jgi:hypothetical protein